jgi:hypothetical protein
MRSAGRTAALLVAASVALSACSAAGLATQAGELTGDVACPSEQFDRGVRVLACYEAVAAAERALEQPHWPTSSANFALGVGNCPRMPEGAAAGQMSVGAAPAPEPGAPNLRCSRIGRNTSGVVLFTFWFGDPVRMYVALDERGVAVASATFMDVEPDVESQGGAADDMP